MYKVSQVAEKLGVSKTAIYKKISKFKQLLKPHIKVVSGVKYIDAQGFEILKDSFNKQTVEEIHPTNNSGELLQLLLSEKDKQIEQLKEQLNKKDDSLNHALKLVENSQVLLKQEQNKVLQLEHKLLDPEEKVTFLNNIRSFFIKSQDG